MVTMRGAYKAGLGNSGGVGGSAVVVKASGIVEAVKAAIIEAFEDSIMAGRDRF